MTAKELNMLNGLNCYSVFYLNRKNYDDGVLKTVWQKTKDRHQE